MSLIINTGRSLVSHPRLHASSALRPSTGAVSGPVGQDRVEASNSGRALEDTVEVSSFRLAQLRAVQDEIARGTYETPERIAGTVERLLDILA